MEHIALKQRGTSSIELKLRYMRKKSEVGRRAVRYTVDFHLFLPQSFRINPDTYDSETFYEDRKLYVRFNTPDFTIDELTDPNSSESPLCRVERLVADQSPIHENTFIYETKMLGAVYKSLLRESLGGVRAVTTIEDEDEEAEPVIQECDNPAALVKQLHQVASRFHSVTEEVLSRQEEEHLHEHCRMIDEHLSLLLERYLTAFLQRNEDEPAADSAYKRIAKVLISELRYRQEQGYPTSFPETEDERKLEEYVYREKMLKKYSSEVLFFQVKTTNEAKRIQHVLYAIAAGIAMAVATSLAFYGQSEFGNITTSLFILLVVSYMVKDRMKDIFRDYFRRSVGARFYDRRKHLYDSFWKKKLATVRERTTFVPLNKTAERIVTFRGQGPFEAQLARSEEESHLLYRKVVNMRAKTLRKLHNRIQGLADITIVDLANMVRYLAVQSTTVPVVTGKNAVEVRSAKRVYHLNLIVDYRAGGERRLERFRLILDRDGIKRIEPVASERSGRQGGSD